MYIIGYIYNLLWWNSINICQLVNILTQTCLYYLIYLFKSPSLYIRAIIGENNKCCLFTSNFDVGWMMVEVWWEINCSIHVDYIIYYIIYYNILLWNSIIICKLMNSLTQAWSMFMLFNIWFEITSLYIGGHW